ncbi:uncharacterized protein LOC110689101 [Chenopodium quinoa]|uniref:uncharacterized protein LOC110689101 n=1 Tax=Chenopodium quinoa TaxID=63459 RepID=UPI000B77AD58|nr:uncharacterized protein LOC110689101 [Chenopodium quinoa]
MESDARERFLAAHSAKLKFLKQKAKLHWMKDGDVNSSYFYACIRKRRVHNNVYSIQLENGDIIQDLDKIAEAFISFYKELLGTGGTPSRQVHQAVIDVGPIVNDEQHLSICRVFIEDDVRNVVWKIEDDKAPGPDGFSRKFFKNAWGVVKNKIISKTLCERLKEVLPGLISENQSAFIAGRSILDNILVCQEMLKEYNNKRKSPRCTIKVDLRKALNFPSKFISWVMECVTSPSFSIMINGGLNGFFKGKKGIRQGDPMSPLANADKSAIYFGSVQSKMQQEIVSESGFVIGETSFRYLGIPLNSKYLRVSDFDAIVDKMLTRITCWSSINLSYIARVVLVNSILISLHTYWAQCVLLPKSVVLRITQLCRAFLWCGDVVLSKAPPISWDWVCKSKAEGGLGIRDCGMWNRAALGKYVWKIAKKEDSLWVKWVHALYINIKDQEWWNYSPKRSAGWAWRRLYAVKDQLKEGFEKNSWMNGTYRISECYKWLQGAKTKVDWCKWV